MDSIPVRVQVMVASSDGDIWIFLQHICHILSLLCGSYTVSILDINWSFRHFLVQQDFRLVVRKHSSAVDTLTQKARKDRIFCRKEMLKTKRVSSLDSFM